MVHFRLMNAMFFFRRALGDGERALIRELGRPFAVQIPQFRLHLGDAKDGRTDEEISAMAQIFNRVCVLRRERRSFPTSTGGHVYCCTGLRTRPSSLPFETSHLRLHK
ncbi:hypothetical protein PsorP6_000768 [Peronosclerospora sorghi]|uniref:Uncharacterized protein n=1 Tax=Peronosclerospora sorghi TaxID=230839 RepID=A0ACC0WVQ3_9STRA|nr:hypothetical protein PsorP6_000768 [Peronosclerospora sorghi]